jgi:para-nitrobenzyl esterase
MAILKVKTENGIVEGLPGNNHIVSVFKGIPFAKPPVGDLRWRAPQPVEPWEGELKTYKFPNIAMQPRFASEGGNTLAAKEFYVVEFPMSEDCLYLNVWTPAKSADEKLPVGVYIHGGAFETGYSYLNAYDGESFAKRGIIIVTIAYRLNVFGFLAHQDLENEDEYDSTGNYGTMDQIAAIEWVKRNISAFGGNPDNITVFGQSAGGASVQNMCQTPILKGKFHRAIMQSGGGLRRGGELDLIPKSQAKEIGQEFLEFIGVENIEEARKVDGNTIVEKYKEFKQYSGKAWPFSPIVDGYVLPENAADYFIAAKHPDIDYMLGCTADEMRNKNAKAPDYEVIKKMAEERFGDLAQKYLDIIKAEDPEYCRQFFENTLGDDWLAGDIAWCENQISLNRKPSFMYYFTYVPPGAEDIGAHHSAEHHYVFQTLIKSFRPYTGVDYDLSNELADYWSNFMKTGNPNGEGLPQWDPYTKDKPKCLEIARERKMIYPPEASNVKFIKDFSLGRLK